MLRFRPFCPTEEGLNGMNCSASVNYLANNRKNTKSPPTRGKYDLLVVRISANGELRNSCPCAICLDYLKKLNLIRYIYYSNQDGDLIRENLGEMISTHLPTSTKLYLQDGGKLYLKT